MTQVTLPGPHEILLVFGSDDRTELQPQGPGGTELPNTGCLCTTGEIGDDHQMLMDRVHDFSGYAYAAIYKVQVTGFDNTPVAETPLDPDEIEGDQIARAEDV